MTVGIVVSTNTRAGSSLAPRRRESQTFAVVQSYKGRTNRAVEIRNPQEYANEFGEFYAGGFGTDFVNMHFASGGSVLQVARAVGPSATAGTLTLSNRVGTPQPAVKIDALGAGSSSQFVTVKVEDGTLVNSVTITVSYKAGTTGVADEIYRNVGLLVDGTVDNQSIIDAINSRSNLVVASNLNPATTTSPTARLAVVTATALSTGTDDAAGATSVVMAGILNTAFPVDLGPGCVVIPGALHTTVAALVAAHCVATRRVAWLAGTYLESEASIGSAAATIMGAANGRVLGLAYPWVQVPYQGGSKWVEPTGFYTGVRSRNSERIGVWQAAAGRFGADEAGYILGLATKVTEQENSDLETQGVSALRRIAGQARPMGWRNLGTDPQFDSFADTDELNAVASAAAAGLADEVFDGIDDAHISLNKAVEIGKSILASRAVEGAYHSLGDDAGYSASGTEDIANSRILVNLAFRRRRDMKVIQLAVTASAYNAPV